MNKKVKKILQYIFFLGLGIVLFYYAYRDFELDEFKNELSNLNYWWLLLVFVFGALSHISRAVRWRMLIEPLGHKPGLANTILSVFILYFINIIIPRGGELARCTLINKYEKVPITKLFGTVVTERVIDVIVLFMMIFAVLIMQLSKLDEFIINHPEFVTKIENIITFNNVLVSSAALVEGIAIAFVEIRIYP